MRKYLVLALLVILGAGTLYAQQRSERLQHRVKLTHLNEWQAIVSCRNGRTPAVSKEIAGAVIVSCEGREE
jgi:hypothetical protein